ncbi:transcription factor Jun [Anthonomus grandis grandis]|uniref:transcription factor Jun n=1 Tax=Anthonomus grandis grandis TaxID=2921223 RepID=UPI002165233C|nr:transcription factor Jun [Anthonomus grandis grandis]XP_050294648.1 transcription factor Jun [Anthonomus grandis grandis]XP_050294655.1 transcription factor Jun [Anthonomus grandis grandis]
MSQQQFNDKQTPVNFLKKNLTLDFSQAKKNLNFPLSTGEGGLTDMLSSPDLFKLKVDTPELENMILDTQMPNTPTPSFPFPKNVTAEQESFAGGFVEALTNLHNSNSQQGSDSNASSIYNDTPFITQIKEEPQTVPNISNSPPVSPVNMEYQERMKLERKRQRNRLAASKCRSRKLERISKLEDKVKLLKTENVELGSMINQLKETVGLLKLEVIEHNKSGCQLMLY